MALSSGNVSKYENLTEKDVLPEKYFYQKKATIIKRFEYTPLGSELTKQASIAKDVINNSREDANVGAKTEDGEIVNNFCHKYIGDKYRNLI